MDILLSLLPVILIGSLLVLWIGMLVHAVKHRIADKALWIGVLVVTNLLSAPFYYFLVYQKAEKHENKIEKQAMRAMCFVALVMIILTVIVSFSAPERNNLKMIPLSEVVRQSNSGELKRIEVKGNDLIIIKKGDTAPSLKSRKPKGSSLYQQGIDIKKVEILIR